MPPKKTTSRQILEASSLGLMFPLAIGLGFLWGWWMDRWLGTWPWLTGLFTVFGIVAAFRNLFKLAASADGDATESGAEPPNRDDAGSR